MKHIREIKHKGEILGIIISGKFSTPGLHFFTPGTFSQQLAYMRHPAGKVIEPHVHNPLLREIKFTQEVLILKKGRMRVDFYDNDRNFLESHVLEAGDVILLATGGHGIEVLEEMECIEIKQGPYAGDRDKTRFSPRSGKKRV